MSTPTVATSTRFCAFCGEEYEGRPGPKGTCSQSCADNLIIHGMADVTWACLWCPRRGDLHGMYSKTCCRSCYKTRMKSGQVPCSRCGGPQDLHGRCRSCLPIHRHLLHNERLALFVDWSTRRASFRIVAWSKPEPPPPVMCVYFVSREDFEERRAYEHSKVELMPDAMLSHDLLEWTYFRKGERYRHYKDHDSKIEKVRRALELGPMFQKQEWGITSDRNLDRFCADMKRCGVYYKCGRGSDHYRRFNQQDLKIVEVVLETHARNLREGAYWI